MWAIKIFDDRDEGYIGGLLDLAAKSKAGIECALYSHQGMPESVTKRLREEFASKPGHHLGLHLSHARTSLLEIVGQVWRPTALEAARRLGDRPQAMTAPLQGEDALLNPGAIRLAREAGWARSAGCVDAVIHMDRGHSDHAQAWRSLDPKGYARESVPAIQAAWSLGLRLHLEKTYESRAWLHAYFLELAELDMACKFGFTFDIGHSRVWEREPLEGWMSSIAKFHALGFGLHFHLHSNPGDADRHDTLGLGQAMGWLDPDPQWAPNGAMPILAEINRLYEDKALLVLENSPEFAQENLGWVDLTFKS